MSLVKKLSGFPTVAAVGIFILCTAAGAWGWVRFISPRLDNALNTAISMYDEYLPKITIRDGHASVKVKQPYLLKELQKEGILAIIDTRPGMEDKALGYLSKVPKGVVISRDAIIYKNPGQTRIIPFKEFPDMVVDSTGLNSVKQHFFPQLLRIIAIATAVFVLMGKLMQVFLFGLIPFLLTRSSVDPPTYGQAVKITILAMIPAVALDLFLVSFDSSLQLYLGAYFLIYLLVLVAAGLALRAGPDQPQISAPLTP